MAGGAEDVGSRYGLGKWVMVRLADVENIREASPKSLLRQHPVQICERLHRRSGGAQFHACACSAIQHPGGDHDHDAWCDLDVNDLAVGSLLTVLALDATSVQRVPTVEDFDFLPDMGRMTR